MLYSIEIYDVIKQCTFVYVVMECLILCLSSIKTRSGLFKDNAVQNISGFPVYKSRLYYEFLNYIWVKKVAENENPGALECFYCPHYSYCYFKNL